MNRQRKNYSTRETGSSGQAKIKSDNLSDVYVSFKGRMFGSWIDADSRANGYNEGDLIENPAYIIESIWRDELGLVTADIDIASVDAIGNTTNGSRKDYLFARSLNTVERSEEIVRRLCYEAHLIEVKTNDGKRRLIALDTNASTAYILTQQQMVREPVRNDTHHSFIRNKYDVGYHFNYATGSFEKNLKVDEAVSSLGDPVNLITNGEFATDVTGWTNYGTGVASHVGAAMVITSNAANDGVYQTATIPIVSGRKYNVVFHQSVSAGTWKLRLAKTASHSGTIVGGFTEQTITTGSGSPISFSFTASESADAYFIFYCTDAGTNTMTVDDVSLRATDFDYTSFTPDESSSILSYGADATASLCGVSQTRYKVKNLLKEALIYVYDTSTAEAWIKKTIERRYAPLITLDCLCHFGGITETSSLKHPIRYEKGDQLYIDHPLLDDGISQVMVFMVIDRVIYRNEKLVGLKLMQMR